MGIYEADLGSVVTGIWRLAKSTHGYTGEAYHKTKQKDLIGEVLPYVSAWKVREEQSDDILAVALKGYRLRSPSHEDRSQQSMALVQRYFRS